MTSFVLATDYRVADYDRWWTVMHGGREELAALGVRHLVVYRAVDDPSRVFVTVGLRSRERVQQLLTSPRWIHWFDTAGVEEIPPVFVGTPVAKIRYDEDGPDLGRRAWGVIVASVVRVADFDHYMKMVHEQRRRSIAAGMRKYWIYRAVDDGDEIMSLQEIETLARARAWLHYPEIAAEFYQEAGVGVYPPIFVGTMAQVVRLEKSDPESPSASPW